MSLQEGGTQSAAALGPKAGDPPHGALAPRSPQSGVSPDAMTHSSDFDLSELCDKGHIMFARYINSKLAKQDDTLVVLAPSGMVLRSIGPSVARRRGPQIYLGLRGPPLCHFFRREHFRSQESILCLRFLHNFVEILEMKKYVSDSWVHYYPNFCYKKYVSDILLLERIDVIRLGLYLRLSHSGTLCPTAIIKFTTVMLGWLVPSGSEDIRKGVSLLPAQGQLL